MEELQSILRKDNFKYVLQELVNNEIPRTLTLVLSTLGQTEPLVSWLLDSFPAEATNYDATIQHKIISYLSTELDSSDFVEDKELCAKYRKVTDITPKVLQYLVSFLRPIDIGSEDYNRKSKAKQPQKKPQEPKREGATTLVKKYFDVLNVNIPETSSEASALVDYVLQSQKETLKFYLELLCRPGVSLSLKEHYVTSAFPIEDGKNVPGSAVEPFAYPIVQPMKSALYFDTAEGFGQWTVVVSSDADNFLRSTHKKDIFTFNVTVKKIKELSCGQFTDNNQKRLSGSTTEYQIDIIPGDDNEQQVLEAIKIFGIYTHAQMDHRLWSSISSQLRKKGKEYRKRCAVRKRADQASTFIPAFFPPLPGVLPLEIEDFRNLHPDETVQIHSRLVVEKYVTFSQPFLETILADVDATFPYVVSTQEKRIIEHPKSCYVIGRSGTGKTTTMLFKMLLIERTFQLMASDLPRPRQVFVTKSKILAKKVQEYFEKLASSLAMASRSPADFTNLPTAPNHQALLRLIDVDDIVDWRTDLPVKYSDLEQRHFPLFITFDGLCDMLETDMRTQTLATTSPIDVKCHMGAITFDYFCECYWSHFPEYLIKRLDPALVFSEIIGIIEGSAETLSDEKPYLSEAAYLDLSSRRQSIPVDQRCKVYQIFKLYLHKKKLHGEYDTSDRTHKILKHFAEQGIPGKGLDHLYVDEVQDNTLIDTMGNFHHSSSCMDRSRLIDLSFSLESIAGDTAQTISVGSSFSFNALKAFQWEIEVRFTLNNLYDLYRRRHSLSSQQPPKMFQLAVNYRSHAGIVNCAHSIIDLITTFWKDSIDCLSPEMGIVDGAKPIFFNNEDRAQLGQFIFCDGDKPIELGAQQCIIVKNEIAKEKLRQKVGEVGIVLFAFFVIVTVN
ncbi:P-loop containing nucleoside triphosphate hydrolase protein [Armillaria novae-zelandiae]|uniref:P-loop containing nucleoside triphosphate hydrolase protein n=1 Tax=Armillaria novae-zelandiae TaxID=153914 RepID=A0AA39U0W8_9AGAR|nr:P-loop containing nucleoside triphosphate hydrolase protein [Armillaria novae-zelandiae]